MWGITRPFAGTTQARIAQGLLLASIVCIWIAAWRAYLEAEFISASSRTLGQVVALSRDKRSPTVEFTDLRGRASRFTPPGSSSWHSFHLGQPVWVRFRGTDSSIAKLDMPIMLWGSTALFVWVSACCLVFGLLTRSGKFVSGPLRTRRISIGL